MFSADHFIHFAFDQENDVHYTGTMLALHPDSYLFYILKQQMEMVLFVCDSGSGPVLQTYDTVSEQLLRTEKKKLFQGSKSISSEDGKLCRSTQSFSVCCPDPAARLGWLLDRPDHPAVKHQKVALVLTLDAFTSLCRSAKEKDLTRLRRLISKPSGHTILVIRLPMHAQVMTDAFTNPDSLLPQLIPGFAQALEGSAEPLQDTLHRLLGEQLVYLNQLTHEDAFHLLLREAAASGQWADSISQLHAQADCLLLSRCYEPLRQKQQALFDQLRVPQFRQALRQQAQHLQQTYPTLSIAEALELEEVETDHFRCPPPELLCDSPLTKNICSLVIPAECVLQGEDHSCLCCELDAIRKSFRTLWNKPTNRNVCVHAESYCSNVRDAAKRQDWQTMRDALALLRFCADHICVSGERDHALNLIFDRGHALIDLSYNVFLGRTSERTFGSAGSVGGYYAQGVQTMWQLQKDAAQVERENNIFQIQVLRSTLQTAMRDFRQRQVSRAALEALYTQAEEQMQQQIQRIASAPVPTIPQKEPVPQPEEAPAPKEAKWDLDEDLLLDWSSDARLDSHISEPQISASDNAPYTEEDRAGDRLVGDALLKRTGLL